MVSFLGKIVVYYGAAFARSVRSFYPFNSLSIAPNTVFGFALGVSELA